jgi:competence protein ComEA
LIRILSFLFLVLLAPLAWADPIDINTADATALDSLPGIGPAKAAAIIAHRDANGPFASVDALGDVTGIGDATIAGLRDFVTAGGVAAPPSAAPAGGAPAPASSAPAALSGGRVNINVANVTQLQDLPGIGPTKAAAIEADRNENGPFASCADLGRVTGIGPATLAGLADACTTQ